MGDGVNPGEAVENDSDFHGAFLSHAELQFRIKATVELRRAFVEFAAAREYARDHLGDSDTAFLLAKWESNSPTVPSQSERFPSVLTCREPTFEHQRAE